MPLKPKPISKKKESFADEVREFFSMSVKKGIDITKQDPEKTVSDIRKAGGRIPKVEIKERKKRK